MKITSRLNLKNELLTTFKISDMNSQENTHDKMNENAYTKFALMLSASFIAMYITMYLNTYSLDRVYFSLTLFYMGCLGISVMTSKTC